MRYEIEDVTVFHCNGVICWQPF